MGKNRKKPSWKTSPDLPQKQPRIGIIPSTDSEHLCWQISSADKHGPFGWSSVSGIDELKWIFERLMQYESMSWAIVQQAKRGHQVSVEKLCVEAQKRLKELQLEDFDDLFSLDLNGRPRIWGIRDGKVLRILWWDPRHEVCPSQKKHT